MIILLYLSNFFIPLILSTDMAFDSNILPIFGFDSGIYDSEIFSDKFKFTMDLVILFFPKLIFLIMLINMIEKYYNHSIEKRKISFLILLPLFILGKIAVDFILISTCCIISFELSKYKYKNDIQYLIIIGIYIVILLLLKTPRGMLLTIVFPFLLKYKKIDYIKIITVICVLVPLSYISSVIKFETYDPLIMFNVLSRATNYTQYFTYQQYTYLFQANSIPSTIDLLKSFPMVRRLTEGFDETQLFADISGNFGGFAVNAEIRSIAYFKDNFYYSIIDLTFMYFIIYLIIRKIFNFFKIGSIPAILTLPYIILADNLVTLVIYMQIVIFISLIYKYLYKKSPKLIQPLSIIG